MKISAAARFVAAVLMIYARRKMMFFKKKVSPEAQGPMDLDAVMQKFDRESNTRIWEGVPQIIVKCILAAFSLFCIYVTLFASWLEEHRLTSFVAFIIFIGYLVYPAKKRVGIDCL